MTTKEILIKARALINTPEKWTRGRYFGIHLEGGRIEVPSPTQEPDCFCATGAIAKVCNVSPGIAESSEAWRALYDACGMLPDSFNDSHEHDAVLAKFDEAIASLP